MKSGLLILLSVMLALSACSRGNAGRPRFAEKGRPAPELRLRKLLNAPAPEIRGWDDLKGKAVVLEFWATWCEDCVDAIPHLNELAVDFAGAPVAFISVTDETEGDVKKFMKEHPMKGWVAPEAGAEIFRSFRVYGRPHTVLITRDGKVAELTTPGAVTDESIKRLLTGLISPQAGPEAFADPQQRAGAPALAEFYISETAGDGGTATYGPDQMQAAGVPLKSALAFIFGPVDRLDVKPEAARAMNGIYDIRLRSPKGRGPGLRREFFLKGLETALGLRVKELSREAEVYVLKTAPGGPVNMKKKQDPGNSSFDGGKCVVAGGSLEILREALGGRLGEPVLDETGLKDNYSYSFDFKDGDKKAINARLGGQLGLRLERRLRKLRVLEISRPEP